MSGGNFGLWDFISMKNYENCLYKYRNWNIITIHHEKQLFSAQKQFLLMDFQQHKMSSLRVHSLFSVRRLSSHVIWSFSEWLYCFFVNWKTKHLMFYFWLLFINIYNLSYTIWFSSRFLATDSVGVVESNLVQIGLVLEWYSGVVELFWCSVICNYVLYNSCN